MRLFLAHSWCKSFLLYNYYLSEEVFDIFLSFISVGIRHMSQPTRQRNTVLATLRTTIALLVVRTTHALDILIEWVPTGRKYWPTKYLLNWERGQANNSKRRKRQFPRFSPSQESDFGRLNIQMRKTKPFNLIRALVSHLDFVIRQTAGMTRIRRRWPWTAS